MFSVVSVCPKREGGTCTGSKPPPNLFKPVKLGPHCTGFQSPCSNLFNLDLTVQDPLSPPLDTFKLVHYEAWAVDKRAVYIRLKCLCSKVNPVISQKCAGHLEPVKLFESCRQHLLSFMIFRIFTCKIEITSCEHLILNDVSRLLRHSTFSHTHKVGNNGINVNFVFPHSCNFLHYLYLKMLVNMKSDVI